MNNELYISESGVFMYGSPMMGGAYEGDVIFFLKDSSLMRLKDRGFFEEQLVILDDSDTEYGKK